jgi:hypothetical protein
MSRNLLPFVFSASTILFGVGCDQRSQFPPVSKGTSQTLSLTLYEGLPHQTWETELLIKELATKKTIDIHGYPFYERPLRVSADDVD